MKTDKGVDLSPDLVAMLEGCARSLDGIRREAERGLAELHAAIEIARTRRFPATTDLRELLQAHHDRLAQMLSSGGAAVDQPSGDIGYPFRLDPLQRVARIGRRRIPLTPSEYQVLEYLWQHMPAPVSRRELLEHLYGGRDETTESVVDMFIFKIRQKLRSAGCTDAAIKGIRGVGWVLELGEGAAEQAQQSEEAELG